MKTMHPVHVARPRDATYVASLQRKFSNEIGFLPNTATRDRIAAGQVLIGEENDEPAGFLLTSPHIQGLIHVRPIYQAAVQLDAQRHSLGRRLVDQLAANAKADGQTLLQCWCRRDLDANAFWQAAGFIAVALRDVNGERGEPCTLWRRPLCKMTALSLAEATANHRSSGAGGLRRRPHDWRRLPLITPFSLHDLTAELRRLRLCA